jgi:uncharacterized protein YggE
MMSAHTRLLVLCGVLIAALAASLTAIVLTRPHPDANAQPIAQTLTLAASTAGNTITVVGVGNGSAVPDRAYLQIGVTATRPSVRDAVSAANSDMSHLLGALHGQGVQDKDVATTSIYVQQQTNCCPQVVTGYSASESVQVTINHLNNVAAVTAASVDAVGNDLQLNGVNLFVADQSGMLKAARSAAMSDASTKAQDYARLSGHHLGGLVGVSEVISTTGGFGCDQCGGKGSAGGGGFQVSPGTQTVTVTVAVTYEIAA